MSDAVEFELKENAQVPGTPYRLIAMIGEGLFGQVWKAEHPTRAGSVALKFCLDRDDLITFRNEAKHFDSIMRAGPFAGFVFLRKLFDEDDREFPFVSYEYIEGENFEKLLDRRFKKSGPFLPPEAAEVIHALAKIMAQIHNLTDPIVHRDLKPSNILVVHGQTPWEFRIADFGVGLLSVSTGRAKELRHGTARKELAGSGTRDYMSYEQSKGHNHPSDDVHALGVMWYELLVGEQRKFSRKKPPSHNPTGFNWDGLWQSLTKCGLNVRQIRLLESCLKRHEYRPENAWILYNRIETLFPDAIPADYSGRGEPYEISDSEWLETNVG